MKPLNFRTVGPVSDLERHLPAEWWKTLFNSLYIKTDGDVVENDENTRFDVGMLCQRLSLSSQDRILDVCCGQGRHSLELARRGFSHVSGIDRSRYLVRLARKRAQRSNLNIQFSEGDARKLRFPENSFDAVCLMGNSFGYFEHAQDDARVLESVMRVLRSEGKLALDITDGAWMRTQFEPRSWEWIDQDHFVCRERSLSADRQRIVSREVIVHAEKGVIADQFYAERLYDASQIASLLEQMGFQNIAPLTEVNSGSTRGQDLGMMAHRIFITAHAPQKKNLPKLHKSELPVAVLLGDPRLPDTVKIDQKFNPEDMETVARLKQGLSELAGYHFSYFDNHGSLLKSLQQKPPLFVLNLCDEGFMNKALQELHIPALLEMLEIPYSGAGPACLGLCYNKAMTRAVAYSLDIPVPQETLYNPVDQSAYIPSIFPALLKPNYGDNSVGITRDAVVHNAEQLMAYLDHLRQELPGTPILIQEFLPGREFSVALLGNPGAYTILPVLEVDYSGLDETLPPILSYEAKWEADSPYWQKLNYVEALLGEDERRRLIDYSMRLFEHTGCRDYARFDFRADAQGEIKLLEVNPNPGWSYEGKLGMMAGFAGRSYSELLEMVLQAALDRQGIRHSRIALAA